MVTNGKSVNEDVPIERELTCKLTEQELLERGDRMAEAELMIEGLKAKRKEVNAQIGQQVERRALLAHVIESGEEKRTVMCKWISDFASNAWRLVRQDNGAEVETKPMTAGDRQADLGLDAAEEVADEDDDDGSSADEDDDADVLVDDKPRPVKKKKKKRKAAAPKRKPTKKSTRRAYA